jgi:hypothetical protein
MKFLKWLLFFIPALAVEVFAIVLNPIVCLFVTRRPREDYVKRLGHRATMPRDYIINPLYWFQTHDNAVDEGWYGKYEILFLENTTQSEYDNSRVIRYWCRLWWLHRNTAYGFLYNIFGIPREEPAYVKEYGFEDSKSFWMLYQSYKSYFKLEMQIPLNTNRYISVNIGWKAHKGIPKVLYANRLIGVRRYD